MKKKMNETEKITQWVECKIGKLLDDDIEERINTDSASFDVENYSQMIFDTHFANETDIISVESLRLNFEPDELYLTDGFSQDSSDDEKFYFGQLSLDNIIPELQSQSEDIQLRGLESLEACSVEELVVHTSWTAARKILQDLIKINSERVSNQVLQIFRRFLLSNDTPKVVCEGFTSLAEIIPFHMEAVNRHRSSEIIQEMYDFKGTKWLNSTPSLISINAQEKRKEEANIEIVFKSMWLLVQSQRGIPLKWSRFNEKRLREIVFSFIHMLSAGNLKKRNSIASLDILSVLDPKATWCNNWCHGATGRLLLCSALKANKRLFHDVVDYVLLRIKAKEGAKEDKTSSFRLPPLNEKIRSKSENYNPLENNQCNVFSRGGKCSGGLSVRDEAACTGNRSAPPFPGDGHFHGRNGKERDSWIIKGVPKEIANEAKFCHCLSMIVYLIQYRGGRSLFPLEVTSRRRRMKISDFVSTVLDYINNTIFFSERNPLTTDEYREHMLKLVEIIKTIGVC